MYSILICGYAHAMALRLLDHHWQLRSHNVAGRDINEVIACSLSLRAQAVLYCMLVPLRWMHRPVALAATTFRPSSRLPVVQVMGRQNETEEQKAARKQAKKVQKEARRLQRQGLGSPDLGQKPCTLCGRQRDLLIRCQVDDTRRWHMVCGKCWMEASGGKVDGAASKPHYTYGGLWKNHHKGLTGKHKVPKAAASKGGGGGSSSKTDVAAVAGSSARSSGGSGKAEALQEMGDQLAEQVEQEHSSSGSSSSDEGDAINGVAAAAGPRPANLEQLLLSEAQQIMALH